MAAISRKRVLVTGASGFTGRYVIPLLKQREFEVHGLSSKDCDVRDPGVLRDAVFAARPDYVIHLAGTAHLPDSESATAFGLNVDGTVNLLRACADLAVRPAKIVLASSSYVYGDTGGAPGSEDSKIAPTDEYGRSKAEMERAAMSWTGRLPIIILRPFNYTGVGHGSRFLVPKLVQLFKERGTDASFVDPSVIRDYSDVRWVAGVYRDILQRPEHGLVLNVCSGVGTPLPRLVSLLEQLSGHSVSMQPRRRTERPVKQNALVGDATRLQRLIEHPSPYSLEDTLSWMLQSAEKLPIAE